MPGYAGAMVIEAIPTATLPQLPRLDEAYYAAKAEESGLDFASLTHRKQKTWRRQVATLEAYAIKGEFTSATAIAGCSRTNVNYWVAHNTMGFRDRLAEAHDRFADRLEAIAHHRVELQKPNDNPVLLIALLNANNPEKYRPSTQPIDDTAKAVLTTLQEVGSAALAARTPPAALEAGGSREQGQR